MAELNNRNNLQRNNNTQINLQTSNVVKTPYTKEQRPSVNMPRQVETNPRLNNGLQKPAVNAQRTDSRGLTVDVSQRPSLNNQRSINSRPIGTFNNGVNTHKSDLSRETNMVRSQSFKSSTSSTLNKTHMADKKVKKFFRIVVPILLIELVLLGALITYLILMPKNYCKISVNSDDAIIYVNNKKTDHFMMNISEDCKNCHYVVDIGILLPEGKDYLITYSVSSEECDIEVFTEVQKFGNYYSMEVKGGVKTVLLNGILLDFNKDVKEFNVKIEINVSILYH